MLGKPAPKDTNSLHIEFNPAASLVRTNSQTESWQKVCSTAGANVLLW
jgi:hypothetical protein